jgi:NAD(P)H-hydrate epimerase
LRRRTARTKLQTIRKRGKNLQKLVTGKEMKLLDKNTSEAFHVPEIVLMEQAAMSFVQELFALNPGPENVLILCGSGNNGADGLAIARLLNERGVKVTALLIGETLGHGTSSSYDLQKKICGAYKIPLINDTKIPEGKFEIIVDAVFGIGLSRDITGETAELLSAANETDAWRVAVDIASGVDADTGAILGTAFNADDTITFSYGKVGQYLWPGSDYSGKVHVMPMGITAASWLEKKPHISVFDREELSLLPKRTAHSNKGTYGKLLVIAGSVGMAGASVLCAQAGYRMGCGLVKVVIPEENRTILQTALPEALLLSYRLKLGDGDLIEALNWADAVVIGPGIGTGITAQHILKVTLTNCRVPIVADADALNLLSGDLSLLLMSHTKIIITPHLGEMSRLTGKAIAEIQSDLLGCAANFSKKYGVVCVLKDFHTVISDPQGEIILNLSGNSGMATAGSGDVLAGIIGSLLAQGADYLDAAALGAYIHGLSGDKAKIKNGERALLASDIIQGLKELKL